MKKKFGDLILWYQIIDKAKDSKKPIVFISGDVKEDWWLERNGKRLMPLPQLKKEMYEKANSDFHIYTADRFLKLSETDENKIDERTIKEIRKIREIEEIRMSKRRMELKQRELKPKIHEEFAMEYVELFENLEKLYFEINDMDIHFMHIGEFNEMLFRLKDTRNRIIHGDFNKRHFNRLYRDTVDFSYMLEKIIHSDDIYPELADRLKNYIAWIKDLNRKIGRYL